MSSGPIAITTATDRGYLPAACCQLKSVADFLGGRGDVRLFLATCDLGAEDLAAARAFFERRGVDAAVLDCTDVAQSITPVNRRWPRAAYLRLYFDSVFGPEYRRLVYFDADTRICAPLGPLLDVDLCGMPVAAAHDFIYYVTGNIHRRRRDLFLKPEAGYLQSGVMVFDWPATLRDGGLARSRDFLAAHPERCQEAPDQDALNAAFEGRWTPLDPRWNLHETYLMFGGALSPYLEHYTSTKPWSRRRPSAWRGAAAWYRRELADTPWADFIPPQSAFDQASAWLRFQNFRYAWRVRDAMARHAPVILDLMGVPRRRDENEERPWAPKSRAIVEAMATALVEEAARQRPPLAPPEAVVARWLS